MLRYGTPLHCALVLGKANILRVLLERGADLRHPIDFLNPEIAKHINTTPECHAMIMKAIYQLKLAASPAGKLGFFSSSERDAIEVPLALDSSPSI